MNASLPSPMNEFVLPKTMEEAQHFLVVLEKKDQDLTLCRFPTCRKLRRPAPEGGGNIPVFCGEEGHTSLANSRLRASIGKLAKGLKAPRLETEHPVTPQMVQVLEEDALVQMKRSLHAFGLYVAAVEEIADPEIATAQIEAAHYRAEAQIALMQETIKTEQAFRKSAENLRDTAQAARDAAQQDARAAREETTLTLAKLQQSEERAQLQQEHHEQEMAKLKQEHETAIAAMREQAQKQLEALREQTQAQIEAIQAQANKDVALAQEKAEAAQQETSAATIRAHDAETRATLEIASAEQRVREAQAALQREQFEVIQLRQARDATATEARVRAETDREEIQQLRQERDTATMEARRRAEDDRKEIQQLRENLDRAIQRADDLARSNDTLRSQLLQIQMAGQEKPEKKEE